jgi:hypothetical protein
MKTLTRLAVAVWLMSAPAYAQVLYDVGRTQIQGIQLLRDKTEANVYYYLPDAPRLSTNPDGTLAFVCLKYVDARGGASGGLFHALVEFSLPADVVTKIQEELRKTVPGARIAGPVPLLPVKKEEGQPGSFEVVSAVLSDRSDKGLTRSVITSGTAPLTPGSQAAVAAMLNAQGATLLWESLSGPTSDVSLAVNAYYEAAVTGFSARVTADVSTVYTHMSSIFNKQQEYSRRQIRDVTDSLVRTGAIKVESMDRGAALNLKTDAMERLLDLITQKLTELVFDHKTGFATDPEREPAVEQGQLLGRQERSWLSRTFGGTDDTKYYTDDQWVMKDRKDIKQNLFAIQLSSDTTIKVPFSTAGNIRGLYGAFKNDERYFRIVNLDDPAFQTRPVHFQVDGEYADSFKDTINFVAVNLRKRYQNPSHADVSAELRFDADALKKGENVKSLNYPRLGEMGPDSQKYEYRVAWSVHDRSTVSLPAPDTWIETSDPVIALVPPFEKLQIDIDADRQNFKDRAVQTAVLEFQYPLVGRTQTARKATLRAGDGEASSRIVLYRDRDTRQKTRVRTSWYFKSGQVVQGAWADLADTYFNLVPPEAPATPAPSPTSDGGGQ